MAALFQLFVHRELTPDQGQVYLAHMLSEIRKNPVQWNPGAVKIPGINRFENPFPQWAQDVMLSYGFEYDSINLCYAGRFPTETTAEVWRKWFDETIRPWAFSQGHDTTDIHARVMTEHPDVDALTAY